MSTTSTKCVNLLLPSIVLCTTLHGVAQDDYALFRISIRESTGGLGFGINELGHVAGKQSVFGGSSPSYWWLEDGILLGTFGGPWGEAADVNNRGVIVGSASIVSPYPFDHPFVWYDGAMLDLGTLGGDQGWAYAVNNRNQVVGRSQYGDPWDVQAHGYVWHDGVMTELPLIAGCCSSADDINDQGVIVGRTTFNEDNLYSAAVIWYNQRVYQIGPDNFNSRAYAINEHMDVVGWSDEGYRRHAFLWSDNHMLNIDTHPEMEGSWAEDINNLGQVVGALDESEFSWITFGFLWQADTGMTLLNDFIPPKSYFKSLGSGQGINDFGQITGDGYYDEEQVRQYGYLLSPVYPTFMLDQPTPGTAGEVNTITARNLTPGTKVYFIYGMGGGGSIIPRCEIVEAALQIDDPVIAGTAVADAAGVATLVGKVPSKWAGQEVLIQGLVSSECDISNLVVVKFE
ncbi:MAG: DUF3466 family protein [Planctomycetes bacterium]|nr:DUF3466 family protein [Planctomycetota bacterium]NOG54601.1 DUF3466 family protein [Planctomycetota bacterium]